MNTIPTDLILNNALCKDCNYKFAVYGFSDFEYGRKLGRTLDPFELGFLDTFNDPVFDEVAEIVDGFLKPLNKDDRQRSDCFDLVFGITCDPSPSGYQYSFSGKFWCPSCNSNNISWGEEDPRKVEKIDLYPIIHSAWHKLNGKEKRELIREALKKVGCLY